MAPFNPAGKFASGAVFDRHGQPKLGIQRAVERTIDIQRPLVLANLRRLRKKNPTATAAELNAKLERDYLVAITTAGAAVGGTAVVPAIGTVVSLGLSAAATVGFLEATALYAQSVAELHGISTEDPERARTLVMGILMGDEGSALIQATIGSSAGGVTRHWGNVVGGSMSASAVRGIGATIRRRFIRRMLARQGGALLGRALPFGVGAAVGAAGNRMMGRTVINATREAFGPPPTVIPGELLTELEKLSAAESDRDA
jgi:hypothetical protein